MGWRHQRRIRQFSAMQDLTSLPSEPQDRCRQISSQLSYLLRNQDKPSKGIAGLINTIRQGIVCQRRAVSMKSAAEGMAGKLSFPPCTHQSTDLCLMAEPADPSILSTLSFLYSCSTRISCRRSWWSVETHVMELSTPPLSRLPLALTCRSSFEFRSSTSRPLVPSIKAFALETVSSGLGNKCS